MCENFLFSIIYLYQEKLHSYHSIIGCIFERSYVKFPVSFHAILRKGQWECNARYKVDYLE